MCTCIQGEIELMEVKIKVNLKLVNVYLTGIDILRLGQYSGK